MSDIIENFGNYIDANTAVHPEFCRRLLTAGLRAFGLKLSLSPDRRLPSSRQYIAKILNHAVVDTLAHPQQSALTSVFQPCEQLYAMGIKPMCAELYSAFINGTHAEKAFAEAAESAGIAETYCSYHKILMGSAYTGILHKPAFIVNTSLVCDANNLTFRALSEYYNVPQFYVDVPPESTEGSVEYVASQLRLLTEFIEEQTGRKMDESALKTALIHTRNTIENFREAMLLRKNRYLPGDLTSEMYEIYTTHIALGTEKAERYSHMLLSDLRQAKPACGIRILWLHTIPFWQEPVRRIFNFTDRAQVITSDINFESLIDIDVDKPYESMARRLTESTFNGGGENRISAARSMARALDIDGIVVFCHWGCKQTMGLSARFKKELEADGFPTLILNGDGCDRSNSSDGQVATRLNAFMELLEGKKA